ncbi:hypothetical protein [Aliiglaciecola lipolytica]|uniref:Uncharacterized protein n=1 Tax=Aliiglaciecola lipolytica E3 TaxID=1127673 RepID=K6YTQ6_9ALTE|nr:hypothetical protein [Aliiglaciecola lipolytica]GAC14670.1 hypothetical protein GLIP_2042 [Aliiglaciecola lipolytica E3]
METIENESTIATFDEFFNLVFDVLFLSYRSSKLLFPIEVRSEFEEACLKELKKGIETSQESETIDEYRASFSAYFNDSLTNPKTDLEYEAIAKAGLEEGSTELNFKFAEISRSNSIFHQQGGIMNLKNLLSKVSILLKSIVGAIPVLGSSLQELIDFIKEMFEELHGRNF